jgi:C4-dicarboxylate-specific signal transduction histidine kinase
MIRFIAAIVVIAVVLVVAGIWLWLTLEAEGDRILEQRRQAELQRHVALRQAQVEAERQRLEQELARQLDDFEYELAWLRLRQMRGGR